MSGDRKGADSGSKSAIIKRYKNRQPDFTDSFTMEYRIESSGITVRCLEHPPDPHGYAPHRTHLYGNGRLDVGPRLPRTLEEAEAMARHWMPRFSIYVRTGNFPM